MNQNYERYDENFQMIQKLEERKIKQIFSDNLSLSTPAFMNTSRKQTDIQYIHKERAILDVRLTNVIQLDLCQFHYIEVPLSGHKKPLVIYFQFTDQAKMKFYISSHTITPNRFNNEESFERKQILRYTEQGEHILFTQRCLYLAIFSQQATTIYAKASFGIKPQQQQKMETESKLRPSTGYQFARSSQFFFTRKPSKDMISLNKNIEQYQPDKIKLQQNLRRVQSARKLSETLHKKKQIFEEKKETLKERFEFQEKKKILKEIILYRNNIDNFLKFQQKLWLQNLYFIQLVSIIKKRYYVKSILSLGQHHISIQILDQEKETIQSQKGVIKDVAKVWKRHISKNSVSRASDIKNVIEGQGEGGEKEGKKDCAYFYDELWINWRDLLENLSIQEKNEEDHRGLQELPKEGLSLCEQDYHALEQVLESNLYGDKKGGLGKQFIMLISKFQKLNRLKFKCKRQQLTITLKRRL